jgi:hypothetical protein
MIEAVDTSSGRMVDLRRVDLVLLTIWCLLTLMLMVSGVHPSGDTLPWAYIFLQIVTLVITAVVVACMRQGGHIFSVCVLVSILMVA